MPVPCLAGKKESWVATLVRVMAVLLIAFGLLLFSVAIYKNLDDVREIDIFPSGPSDLRSSTNGTASGTIEKTPKLDWLILLVFSAALFFLDFAVLQHLPDGFKVHVLTVILWIVVAMIYACIVWVRMGKDKAVEWFTGYLLEWMLSMDNLFVFHIVFSAYKTPPSQIHKAVYVGIVGAVVARFAFFWTVSFLLNLVHWIKYPFGGILIWSGIKTAKEEDDDDEDVADTKLMRAVKQLLGSRLLEHYDEGGAIFLFNAEAGWQVTPLFLVVACLELTDILFAFDSVSAKIAQIPDRYIAFGSTVISMFALRAMFFIVKDLVQMFSLLKYGLSLILIFIGIELMFADYIQLSPSQVCILIVAVFVTSIAGSATRYEKVKPNNDV